MCTLLVDYKQLASYIAMISCYNESAAVISPISLIHLCIFFNYYYWCFLTLFTKLLFCFLRCIKILHHCLIVFVLILLRGNHVTKHSENTHIPALADKTLPWHQLKSAGCVSHSHSLVVWKDFIHPLLHTYMTVYVVGFNAFLDFRMAHIHNQRYLQTHKNDIKLKEPVWLQERESTFWSHFCSCDLLFFYWPEWRCMDRVCVCVQFTPDGGCLRSPTPLSRCPVIPARLSGRALDGLSDEMMTLLWEVIPEWGVLYKDCTLLPLPCRSAAPHCHPCRWWLIRMRWITGSTHWFFRVLSKIYIYSCIQRAQTPLTTYPLF